MNLTSRFMKMQDFDNYDDFCKNAKLIVPDNFNFAYDVVDEYANLTPDKRALVWCNDKGESKTYTFKDIKTLSDKACNLLINHGIKRGDVVMTMLARRYEYWIIAVACHKLGAILVPATFLLCAKDISYRANSASVKMLICINENEVTKHVIDAKTSCPTIETYMTTGDLDGFCNFDKELESASSDLHLDYKPCNNDELLVYFTSGTTGYPKMVAHNHNYPLGHIFTAKYWQNVQDDGLHFTMAESGWAKCSWGKIYGQWIAGSAVFVYDYFGKFTPTDVLPLLSKYNVTTFCAPPTIYRFLIKEDLSKYDTSTLVHCSTAGEPLNPEIAKQFLNLTGHIIKEGFGQTESTVLLGTFVTVEPRYGSMGKPCPLYDIVLLKDDNTIAVQGEVGELCVRLPKDKLQVGLLFKYHNDAERTRRDLDGKYYHTGDLATVDEDGYYWFVGRRDDIIKSSGYRIGPFEVESALHEHPSVLECAITGVPDPLRGQIVKATIVLAKGFTPSDELIKELQNHVKQATAPYKYPRVIEFVKELPKTVSGKIRRVEIRKTNKKD